MRPEGQLQTGPPHPLQRAGRYVPSDGSVSRRPIQPCDGRLRGSREVRVREQQGNRRLLQAHVGRAGQLSKERLGISSGTRRARTERRDVTDTVLVQRMSQTVPFTVLVRGSTHGPSRVVASREEL